MNIEDFLGRLRGVRQTGEGSWMAICPCHEDKNGSLHVTTTTGGAILMHCFAGCRAGEVLRAMGLSWGDLQGERREPIPRPRRRYGCTLADYAFYKRLPLETLRGFGLEDGFHQGRSGKSYPCVVIPYLDQEGKRLRARKRMTLGKWDAKPGETAPQRFLWEAGRGDRGNGFSLSLYGLWRIPDDRGGILLVEGESDCHTLWAGGYASLGVPGVSNFNPKRDDPVLGSFQHVCVHIEPDGGGRNLFRRLTGEDGRGGSACLSKMLFFSLPGYKDPSDAWVALGGRREAFRQLMDQALASARPWKEFPRPKAWEEAEAKPPAKPAGGGAKSQNPGAPQADTGEMPGKPEGAPRGRKPADYAGVAREFLQGHMWNGIPAIRFWRQGWYQFGGRCYAPMADSDLEGEVMAFLQSEDVQETYRVLPTAGAVVNTLANLRAAGLCWIPQALPLPSWISTREPAPGWMAMENGILDVETAALWHLDAKEQGDGTPGEEEASRYCRPLTADLLTTYAMPYPYDRKATAPRFLAWLESTQPDPELREVIQMLLGLCLVPDTSYNVCFFLHGEAGTGKTTFLRILERLVGQENCCHVPLLKFGERFQTWPLAEKLVNVVGELPSDDPQGRLRYIEGDFKDSISGEMVDCEKKGRDVCKARCIARHIFATNTLPKFFDKSEGIWDRLRIIPFRQRFRGSGAQVKDIEKTFLPEELPGIFVFALEGLAKLRRLTTFPDAPAMVAAKMEHKEACDPDRAYLLATYEPQPGSFVPLDMAYEDYKKFLMDNGFRLRSSSSFSAAVLSVFGIRVSRPGSSASARARGFAGIAKKFYPAEL